MTIFVETRTQVLPDAPPVPVEYGDMCPKTPWIEPNLCSTLELRPCVVDEGCPRGQKCCESGCGKSCFPGIPSLSFPTHQAAGEQAPSLSEFIPNLGNIPDFLNPGISSQYQISFDHFSSEHLCCKHFLCRLKCI